MTEQEWLTATEPWPWFQILHKRGKFSDRKARLFVVAVCRRVWPLLTDERSRRAVESAEGFADGFGSVEELTAAYYAANVAHLAIDPLDECYHAAAGLATAVAYAYAPLHGCDWTPVAAAAAADTVADASENAIAYKTAKAEELAVQFRLLCDLVGNPFRPVIVNPSWLTPEVVVLAQHIYHQRAFERMPELAAALQEVGCACEAVLSHCREQRAVHVRGCFVLDLVLGKG